MIHLTEKAASEIKSLIEAQNLPQETGLRFGVRGGGCSGLGYSLNFDLEAKENDMTFDSFGVKIVVDTKSFLFLSGTTLDYTDGVNGAGFVFKNPNEQGCGCGSSCGA